MVPGVMVAEMVGVLVCPVTPTTKLSWSTDKFMRSVPSRDHAPAHTTATSANSAAATAEEILSVRPTSSR